MLASNLTVFPIAHGYFLHVTALSPVATDLEYLRQPFRSGPGPQRSKSSPGARGSCCIPKDDQRSDEQEIA